MSDHTRGLLAAGIVVLCWSGFNIVSRVGSTGALTPYDIAALRFAVSGLLALPFFLRMVPVAEYPRYFVLAMVAGVGYSLLAYSGFAYAPTAHAGVFINGGIPFWTVILVAVTAGFHLSRRVLVALGTTSAGLLLIAGKSLGEIGDSDVWKGDVLFLIAALLWAVFGMLGRHWKVPPRSAIVGMAVISLVVYTPVYLLWLPKTIATAPMGEIVLQAVYQGIVAALLAGAMYTYACQTIGVYRASMTLAIVPGASAIGAWILLGEALTVTAIAGLALVSIGALLSARR
ncbi:EamA/RhaT family transporter [Pseudazoarcus pumilus]|uniref:EamA/RhaT family transporter n=1 Tax=Pseudazoarcus pumilus TaxID=2067960 RepID=A0A2I6S2K8_9RHOO|nr:EamA/RhaT family transporter [Pseudazoarcus pumilus]